MTLSDPAEFLDYRSVAWSRVKRTRFFCYQQFLYTYTGPVRNLRQKLLVVPAQVVGDQRLCDFDVAVSPHPATHRSAIDRWGNQVLYLDVGWIRRSISFEVRILVERTAAHVEPHTFTPRQAEPFREHTDLTLPDERMKEVAYDLRARSQDPVTLAEHISEWVADAMRYGSGVTGVHTPAAQALRGGKGLCQDYAHIMLGICRAAGLPARYVSGHMLADGGSHAWVDVLLPLDDQGTLQAVAFDPTNRRRPNMSYTFIAAGRDYRDVAPTSGVYSGNNSGHLRFTKRAGLTLVEYADGELIEAQNDMSVGAL
jgi:transglutaminase-like putative cysteine protease